MNSNIIPFWLCLKRKLVRGRRPINEWCWDSKRAVYLDIFGIAYKRLSPELKERIKYTKLRYLTDINRDNIIHCKELLKFAHEVHHLEGAKANFSVSKTEYKNDYCKRQGNRCAVVLSEFMVK
ncbi:MAG: hypothetical protein ACRD47_13830 [Nitrososphaeraceae archaeon]